MKATLIISHGSRSPQTLAEIKALAAEIRARSGLGIVRYAFLELESPSIPEGIDECVTLGADEVVVVLNFLNAGRHVDADIPEILSRARQKHPGVKIVQSRPVGQHPGMIPLFLDLIDRPDT